MLRPFDAQLISCIFSLIELSIITLIGMISFCQAVISNTTAEKNNFFLWRLVKYENKLFPGSWVLRPQFFVKSWKERVNLKFPDFRAKFALKEKEANINSEMITNLLYVFSGHVPPGLLCGLVTNSYQYLHLPVNWRS